MKVWILGGTTEGRALLAASLPSIYTVATDYGAELAGDRPGADVRVGRLDIDAMCKLLQTEPVACVLDATHPYAVEASSNARAAAERCAVPYIRVLRESTPVDGAVVVQSVAEAARYLMDKPGNILLATGSKELEPFLLSGLADRVYVRVLPTSQVLARLEALGLPPGRVIAMQGPFSTELNTALLRQVGAKWLVTKDGGAEGGMAEKLQAAQLAGTAVVLVGRPEERGISVAGAVETARRLIYGQDTTGKGDC